MVVVVWDINSVYFEQLLDPIKVSIFLKIEKANKSIFPIEIQTLFLGNFGGPFFLHYNLNSTVSLEYLFGSL